MAALRKANAYSKRKVVPFTRKSKKRTKSFIKAVPPQKIVKFTMGKEKLFYGGKLPHKVTVVSAENVQLRHNAMEATRQFVNKKIDKVLSGNYLFKILQYPHHVQRENKMLTGAGADRMQSGMQRAFGKSMGKSAILKTGSRIFVFGLPAKKDVAMVRKVLNQVKSKLPGKIKIVYEEIEGPQKKV